MAGLMDVTGKTFGRLTVLERAPNIGKQAAWVCRCSCGCVKRVQSSHLRAGRVVSCGCWKNENAKRRETVHGKWGSPLHRVWLSMRQRCNNPKNKRYSSYGGRGITVCPEWDEFQTFETWALDHGYTQGLSLDREDNDGGYNPGNCRWATPLIQNSNTRKNRIVESALGSMTLAELARQSGINAGTLWSRVKAGVSADQLLDLPR